jgi:hypothetical protein
MEERCDEQGEGLVADLRRRLLVSPKLQRWPFDSMAGPNPAWEPMHLRCLSQENRALELWTTRAKSMA